MEALEGTFDLRLVTCGGKFTQHQYLYCDIFILSD